MLVYIVGRSTVKICRVRNTDRDKHFFAHRGQIYKVYPEGLTTFNRYRFGEKQDTEELIVYSENSTVPWQTHGIDYSASKVLSEIDEHKLMTYGSSVKKRSYAELLKSKTLGDNLWTIAVIVILAIAVVPSLIGGML